MWIKDKWKKYQQYMIDLKETKIEFAILKKHLINDIEKSDYMSEYKIRSLSETEIKLSTRSIFYPNSWMKLETIKLSQLKSILTDKTYDKLRTYFRKQKLKRLI